MRKKKRRYSGTKDPVADYLLRADFAVIRLSRKRMGGMGWGGVCELQRVTRRFTFFSTLRKNCVALKPRICNENTTPYFILVFSQCTFYERALYFKSYSPFFFCPLVSALQGKFKEVDEGKKFFSTFLSAQNPLR